jgi:hypothetical protein
MNREKLLWTPVDACVKARSHRTAYGIWYFELLRHGKMTQNGALRH